MPNQEGAKETTGLRIQIRDGFCWAKILYSILVSELKSTFFFCECSSSAVLHVVADVMAESCLFEFWLEQRVADLRIVGVGGVSTCRGQRRFAMGHSTVNRAYQCKWEAQQLVVCEENECDYDSGAYVKPSSNLYRPVGFTSQFCSFLHSFVYRPREASRATQASFEVEALQSKLGACDLQKKKGCCKLLQMLCWNHLESVSSPKQRIRSTSETQVLSIQRAGRFYTILRFGQTLNNRVRQTQNES